MTHWTSNETLRLPTMVRDGLITQRLAEELLLQSAGRSGLNGMEILTTARSAFKQGAR
jgi:hypothetical protein